jgi:hypothetical protein
MLGSAVYLAHTVQLEAVAPGVLPAAVAAFAIVSSFLVGPSVRGASANRHAFEKAATAVLDLGPPPRAANGWKMAGFIVDPTDASWRDVRGYVEQVARPATIAMIEAVVVAARRQWHSGPVPLKKDGFVADILASPEVAALGTMAPRMDVVRKILDGEHPTLVRAADLQRASGQQPTA